MANKNGCLYYIVSYQSNTNTFLSSAKIPLKSPPSNCKVKQLNNLIKSIFTSLMCLFKLDYN